jgi:hypothetical protein
MKLCSPACHGVHHGVHHVPSCSIRQARCRTANCRLYVFYQVMVRKAEPELNPPLYVSWRFTAPHVTNLPNRCMFGSNRLILLTLACCIIDNSINKNTRPGFDSASHLPDFLSRFFFVHSPIFLESCLSVASWAVICFVITDAYNQKSKAVISCTNIGSLLYPPTTSRQSLL